MVGKQGISRSIFDTYHDRYYLPPITYQLPPRHLPPITYLSGVDPKALVEPERRRACAEDQDEAGGGASEETEIK